MDKFMLMRGVENTLLEKAIELNRTILKCAITEPANFPGCIHRESLGISPSMSAARVVGMGELDLSPEDVLIDGIVVDEEKAKSTPCKCIKYGDKDLCWSPGIIGMLSQEQIKPYCPTIHWETSEKLVNHLNEFKRIAEETKGMPIAEKIKYMKEKLSSHKNELSGHENQSEEVWPSLGGGRLIDNLASTMAEDDDGDFVDIMLLPDEEYDEETPELDTSLEEIPTYPALRDNINYYVRADDNIIYEGHNFAEAKRVFRKASSEGYRIVVLGYDDNEEGVGRILYQSCCGEIKDYTHGYFPPLNVWD